MVKKEEIVEAPKPKKIHVAPIEIHVNHTDASKLDYPGWCFAWQSTAQMAKAGWGIYRPVERDSELGESIAKDFGVTGERFVGINEDVNYFYNGVGTILAYTSQELHDAAKKKDEDAANHAMSAIGGDIDIVRHAVIDRGAGNK